MVALARFIPIHVDVAGVPKLIVVCKTHSPSTAHGIAAPLRMARRAVGSSERDHDDETDEDQGLHGGVEER